MASAAADSWMAMVPVACKTGTPSRYMVNLKSHHVSELDTLVMGDLRRSVKSSVLLFAVAGIVNAATICTFRISRPVPGLRLLPVVWLTASMAMARKALPGTITVSSSL